MLDELKLAVRLGFFVVADDALATPCDRQGRVLRFRPDAPEAELRRCVVRSLTAAHEHDGANHTLTY